MNRFVLSWLALMVAGVVFLFLRVDIETDLTAFMPTTPDPLGRLVAEQLREGPAARLILVAIEGTDFERLSRHSRKLATGLRADGRFTRVDNGESSSALVDAEKLFAWRYLLAPDVNGNRNAGQFSTPNLRAALQQRLAELASPLASFDKQRLSADPTAVFRNVLQHQQPDTGPARQHGVWFSPDSKRALLVVQTRAAGLELDAQHDALSHIQLTFETTGTDNQTRLIASGPAVFAVESRERIRSATRTLSIVATLFLIVLLLLIYRSPRAVLLGALPLATAMLVGTVTVTLMFGALHGITLAFGITLLGVAIDYPLHLFSHLENGKTVDDTMAQIWPTLRLGVITTTLGYLVMAMTEFAGLAQLGVFAASGLLAAAACCRWVLPRLIDGKWHAPFEPATADWMMPLLSPQRLFLSVLALLVAASLTFVIARDQPVWETDIAALSPIPAELRDRDQELRNQLGAPDVSHAVLITATTAEIALQRTEVFARTVERWADTGVIDGFSIVSNYLPSAQTQQQRQAALPDAATLENNLNAALDGLGFRQSAFQPFLEAVQRSAGLPPLRPADISDTAFGARVASLLYPLADGWVSLIPLRGVSDASLLASDTEHADIPGAHYLNLRAVSSDTVNTFRIQALSRLGWGALAALLLLAISLRDTRRLLAVCLPLVVALTVDIALLLALGQRLSLFHLIALILVVGIGLDYGLFFSLPHHDPLRRRRTLHALAACAVSTSTVFGIIATSDIPVLRATGATVALGVITSFVAAMVLAQRYSASNT